MRRNANIKVKPEWFFLLIMAVFSLCLLCVGIVLLFEGEIFEPLVCLLFGAIGVFGTLTFKLMTTKAYVFEQVIEWHAWSVLGGSDFRVIPFSMVKRVDIQSINSGRMGKISQRLALVCDEFTLPLSNTAQSRVRLESLRNEFLEALTMQASTDDFDIELNRLIDLGEKILAIKYIQENKKWSLAKAKNFLKNK